MKEMTSNPIPVMKINLMWVKNLNMNPETIKLLAENMEEKLLGPDFRYDFFLYTTNKNVENTPVLKSHNPVCLWMGSFS